jgi:HEAT repeat protein
MTAKAAIDARESGDLAALLDLLSSTDRVTRWAAAQQLGKLGDPAAVDALMLKLQARDDGLRVSTIRALVAIGDPSAVEALIDVVESDPASGVRVTAIEALALLGDPRGGEMLALLAVDPSSLLSTSQRRFDNFKQNGYASERRWATKRLRQLRPPAALPVLEAAHPSSPLQRLRLRQTRRALRKSPRLG